MSEMSSEMSDNESSGSFPDDADPTTEEGAERLRRHDAKMDAITRAELDAVAESHRGPPMAYEIPEALYDKAEEH